MRVKLQSFLYLVQSMDEIKQLLQEIEILENRMYVLQDHAVQRDIIQMLYFVWGMVLVQQICKKRIYHQTTHPYVLLFIAIIGSNVVI